MADEQNVTAGSEGSGVPELDFRILDSSMEIKAKGHVFIFNIPTSRQIAAIGIRARKLRMEDSPGSDGSEEGLGWFEASLYRAMATFEVLLKTSSDVRLFSEDGSGKPLVDSSKWGKEITTDYLLGVYEGYLKALDSFRDQVDGPATAS